MEQIGSVIQDSVLLALPLIVSGSLHMVVVRRDLLPSLKIPLWRAGFGANKTLRGFVVMPVLTLLGLALTRLVARPELFSFDAVNAWWLGTLLGLSYVLFELPNSFLKRRMGIPPGKQAERNRALFFLLDHLDSSTGCAIAYALLLRPPFPVLLAFWLLAPGIHIAVNLMLFALRLRKEPW